MFTDLNKFLSLIEVEKIFKLLFIWNSSPFHISSSNFTRILPLKTLYPAGSPRIKFPTRHTARSLPPIAFRHWSAVFRIGSRRSEAAGAGARPGQVHPEEAQAESQAEDAVHHAAAALPGEKVSRKAVPNHRRTSGILVVPSPYGNAGETPRKLSFQSRTFSTTETCSGIYFSLDR